MYGTAAWLVFPSLFFPEFSETAGILLSLSTYAVGFAARPLGGIVCFSPLIAVALIAACGYGAVGSYTAAMALVTAISVLIAAETFRSYIGEEEAQAQRLVTESQEA